MDNITSQEYWAEIAELAKAAKAEEKSGGDVHDYIHENVDSHQWIIYTFYNMQVLQHSSNENAYFDDFGKLETEDFSSTMARLAYAAMAADIRDRMATLESEDEPEPEPSQETLDMLRQAEDRIRNK